MQTAPACITEQCARLCDRFTAATGWPLEFIPGLPAAADGRGAVWTRNLSDGGRPLGVLRIGRSSHAAGAAAPPTSVTALADGLAELVLAAASANRRLESTNQHLGRLLQLDLAVHNDAHPGRMLERLLQAACDLTGYSSAAFYLLNPNTNQLRLRGALRCSQWRLASERDLACCPADLEAICRGAAAAHQAGLPLLPSSAASGLCAGVRSQSIPLGTLWVFDPRPRSPEDREVGLLKVVASRLAEFLERIVLLRESAVQHRLLGELRIASETQAIPMRTEPLERLGFDVSAQVESRHEVGGDLLDAVELSPQAAAIAIGDASGNSIPAALVMAAVRGALRAAATADTTPRRQPEALLARLNKSLHAITGAAHLMSFLYGTYDRPSRRLTYSNAGHPVPLLLRRGEVHKLESHGLLLGVMEDVTYGSSSIEVELNDVLIFYSDGISEAMDARRELFRADGILAAALGGPLDSARAIHARIWEAVRRHADGGGEADDRSLLVLRRAD